MNNPVQASFQHLMGLAQRSHQKGDLEMAINLYREALKVIPKQGDALHLLGIAYCSQNDFTKGISYLEKAVLASPQHPILLTNLANAYLKTDAYNNALPLLQQAVTIKPDFDEAWHKLANTLKALNRLDEAQQAYLKTIALNPNHTQVYYNMGNLMMSLGNYKTAITHYEKALQINPDFVQAHNNLAIMLVEWDRMDEAEQHYLKAIHLQKDYTEAINNLVQLYNKRGQFEEAQQWSTELLRLNPSDVLLRFELETKAPLVAKDTDEIDAYRNYLSKILDNADPAAFASVAQIVKQGCYPSSELIYQGKNNRSVKEKFARLFSPIPCLPITHQNTKPHIGFVVTKGHEGVFLKCMSGLLNHINTDLFDVSIACSLPNGQKIIAPALTNNNIRFINLPFDFSEAQQLLVNAKLDLLHYWEIGTDATNYFLALTKPAKIQVTSWGWPITSGLKSVDYFISQKNLEPDQAQEHYTEQLVLFDRMPVYYYKRPAPAIPKPLTAYGLPLGKRLYICQQNLRKVHPDFDGLVSSILEKDTDGLVLFIKDSQEAITDALHKRMQRTVAPFIDRVLFVPRMTEEDYLGLLAQCAVALDTLHYGGGANTIYDTVQMGLPLVTLKGNQHSARFAYAAFQQLGCTDTVVENFPDYAKRAVEIATQPDLRNAIVHELKSKAHLIFEDSAAVKELEHFFLEKLN